MFRLNKLFLIAICVMFLSILVIGCGTSIPSINSTTESTTTTKVNQPKGLAIRGVVYGCLVDGNIGQPLAGAILYLCGDQVSKVTTSDANGQYIFSDLPANTASVNNAAAGYNIVATKEGYQRTFSSDLSFGQSSTVADNSVLTYNFNLSSRPIVLSISPAPSSTIESGAAQTITVVFNEAMDVSAVRPTLVCQGLRVTGAIGDTAPLTTSWSSDYKTLTITTGALLPNQTYRLQIDPNDLARDLSGCMLDQTAGQGGGLAEVEYNQNNANRYYRTASGGVPVAPSNLVITLNHKLPANAAYADIITGVNHVDLYWDSPASGQISGYRVYVGLSTNGPWNSLAEITNGNLNQCDSTVNAVNTALFGTTNVDPVCFGKWAFENNKVYFKTVAFNGEGESAAVTGEAKEETGPTVGNTTRANGGFGNACLANNYYLVGLDATADKKNMYLAFTKPIDPTSVAKANFTFAAATATTVNSVTVLTNSSAILGSGWGGNTDYAILSIKTDQDLTAADGTRKLTVKGVKDFAGNTMTDAVINVF